jgi:hypothetical protein
MYTSRPQHTASLDSLDILWSKVSDLADDDEDADFLPKEKEPEAWSVTVDMKTLKRLHSKDIKRQDHIWGKFHSFEICIIRQFERQLFLRQLQLKFLVQDKTIIVFIHFYLPYA